MSRPAAATSDAPRRRGGPRLRYLIPVVVLAFLSPAIYSWTRMALQPSSLPLGVRSVEWLRLHHLNWLVDDAEHVYYSWRAPSKGGPQLKVLPKVGLPAKPRSRTKPWPPPIEPVFAQ